MAVVAFIVLLIVIVTRPSAPAEQPVSKTKSETNKEAKFEAQQEVKSEPLLIKEPKANTFTDPRNNKTYKIVKIGTQTWMAENLNDASKGGKCHEDKPENCEKHGRIYNYEEAKEACPKGWRLPSDADWTALINFAGGSKTAGRKLKAKRGWSDGGNGTDDYNFSLTPDGDTKYSRLWSSTEHNADTAWRRRMDFDRSNVLRDKQPKVYQYSVRCIR